MRICSTLYENPWQYLPGCSISYRDRIVTMTKSFPLYDPENTQRLHPEVIALFEEKLDSTAEKYGYTNHRSDLKTVGDLHSALVEADEAMRTIAFLGKLQDIGLFTDGQ